MSRETSAGVGRPYGLERVCRVLEFPRSTIYAQEQRQAAKVVPLHPVRRGPKPICIRALSWNRSQSGQPGRPLQR